MLEKHCRQREKRGKDRAVKAECFSFLLPTHSDLADDGLLTSGHFRRWNCLIFKQQKEKKVNHHQANHQRHSLEDEEGDKFRLNFDHKD